MPVSTRILYPGSKRSPLEDTRKFFGRAVCHSQKEGSAGFSGLEADQIGFCTVQPSDASAAAVNEQLSEGIAAGEQAVEKAVGKTL